MTIPAQLIKKEGSRTTWLAAGPQLKIGEIHSQHYAQAGTVCPNVLEPTAQSQNLQLSLNVASVEKTRAALLKLNDYPSDNLAITVLWEENRGAIEGEMNCHLRSSSDSALLERILSGLVSHARFFCAEVDDPKAWVARCANLEARRVALSAQKT
jgi:hypothetical protein